MSEGATHAPAASHSKRRARSAKQLYTLQATITDGQMTDEFVARNPVSSRTIEIRADQTLNQLHWAILEAFGRWDDCHLSEFHLGDRPRNRHAVRYVLPFIYDDPNELDQVPPTIACRSGETYGIDRFAAAARAEP